MYMQIYIFKQKNPDISNITCNIFDPYVKNFLANRNSRHVKTRNSQRSFVVTVQIRDGNMDVCDNSGSREA